MSLQVRSLRAGASAHKSLLSPLPGADLSQNLLQNWPALLHFACYTPGQHLLQQGLAFPLPLFPTPCNPSFMWQPRDLLKMQIRGCHSLLKPLGQPPILNKMKAKILSTANRALHELALPTSSLTVPSDADQLPPVHQASPASEHLHLLLPLPGMLIPRSSHTGSSCL